MKRRTLLRIIYIDVTDKSFWAVIHTWDNYLAINFPISVVDNPEVLRKIELAEILPFRVFALCNLTTNNHWEISPEKFEIDYM